MLTAERGEDPDTLKSNQRIKIDLAIGPGFEPGLLSESITVYYSDDRPSSQLYLYGIVVEDIQVTPLALVYIMPDSPEDETRSESRTLKVTSNLESPALEIVDVSDPAGLLDYTVTEIEPNKSFEIEAVLKPTDLADDAAIASNVIITTNHAEQQTIKIPVRVERK